MNKFLMSLKTLKGWNEFFENCKWLVILFYLSDLSEAGNHLGVMAVLVIYLFQPCSECIKYLVSKKNNE